ncbi:MAG: hypothetical protein HCA25_10385 [Dolichospermum sp. DET50]|nr:hypothetical protein [Dolichospermum sp. DET66]MBS3032672.1 hypothetical protein [Dolichospermum sp. DET67]MBS3037878.1 hypothetical protein [Dolichospermum sp. DET50]QSX69807.1 MAG: hypothetical protein EZY12_09605 [Dolichospermum sp. DET69]
MKNLKDNPDEGFSLLEVVVAILMIFFFTTTALQMLVVSSFFKKQATQYTTAINLIQQDMEKIKSAADTYSLTTALTNTSCNPTTSSSGMATYFMNSLPTTATGISNTAYTVTVNGNAIIYNAVIGTPTLLKSQYYWLLRNQTVSTDAPYNVLKLNYVVQAGTATSPYTDASTAIDLLVRTPLSTSYTEVIPYASLQCPSQ